jgi:hypothetical protein
MSRKKWEGMVTNFDQIARCSSPNSTQQIVLSLPIQPFMIVWYIHFFPSNHDWTMILLLHIPFQISLVSLSNESEMISITDCIAFSGRNSK